MILSVKALWKGMKGANAKMKGKEIAISIENLTQIIYQLFLICFVLILLVLTNFGQSCWWSASAGAVNLIFIALYVRLG